MKSTRQTSPQLHQHQLPYPLPGTNPLLTEDFGTSTTTFTETTNTDSIRRDEYASPENLLQRLESFVMQLRMQNLMLSGKKTCLAVSRLVLFSVKILTDIVQFLINSVLGS